VAARQSVLLRYAAFLAAITGVVRVSTPGSAAGRHPTQEQIQEQKKESTSSKHDVGTYDVDLERTVLQFFRMERDPEEPLDTNARWKLPPDERKKVRFVFALLPDPVHTHLGLLFDRSIAAIQLAAQRQHYVFDRAILPWDRSPHQDTDLDKRREEVKDQHLREADPGLLIFREGLSRQTGPNSDSGPLFVFVIGETPTGGVRTLQFQRALTLMRKIRGTDQSAESEKPFLDKPLRIFGPAFSGSLASLAKELNATGYTRPVVFSGTVTDQSSIRWFEQIDNRKKAGRFASFQQNDHYVVQRFVDFVCSQRYGLSEVAVLSEDNTVYGSSAGQADSKSATGSPNAQAFTCPDERLKHDEKNATPATSTNVEADSEGLLYLHFPREISFFRSAYQKATAAQSPQDARAPGKTTLTLDIEDTGSDDDTVAPYGGSLTPLSQEAVMLGLASELQKHHVRFIVLFATDPGDQIFLARYLRTAYPEGRVIVTVPDLLFSREEDTLLHGVLGLGSYALVPGLGDRLCQQEDPDDRSSQHGVHNHTDRLFSSSYTVGNFNAMLALLGVADAPAEAAKGEKSKDDADPKKILPAAHYVEYAGLPRGTDEKQPCSTSSPRPLVWLTILGRDGFWPVAPLDADPLDPEDEKDSTLKTAKSLLSTASENSADTPDVWYTAYCFCLLLMVIHAGLSWGGSTLSDSESSAQFARSEDKLGAFTVATGALVLAIAYVALMCARSPFLSWKAPGVFNPVLWTILLWVPLPAFLCVTWRDLAFLRKQRTVAIVFTLFAALISAYLLFFDMPPRSHIYWLPRVVHLSSTVSPVVPFLLLLVGAYWWTWQSLRGVTLVDLRRPRLPEQADLPREAYRISDSDAEVLRETAHPFTTEWRIYVPILILIPFALTVVDYKHPVQTVEGFAYDAGYSLLLLVMLAVFLGCLLKLVLTWFTCRHILGGLNRLVLRRAFGRMKGISWHSMWNPGGSTLRETYKLMSRALENLTHLRSVLSTSHEIVPPAGLDGEIGQTTKMVQSLQSIYDALHPQDKRSEINYAAIAEAAKAANLKVDPIRDLKKWENKRAEGERILMAGIEALQKMMAKIAGRMMVDVLSPLWHADRLPVVSVGTDFEEGKDKHSTDSGSKESKPKENDADPPERVSLLRLLAEEYVALIYVNFLVTVLLRVRTMIVCAIGLYVFLVLSLNAYPFEPHPALQSLSVLLIVLLGAAVGFVYTEMHRDPVLSRLTSSEPGELGWDFWLKALSAAAIPLFSLLATQFPAINQVFTSWLQPALEAVK
jgi:hypothetical protein